jgi:hypothetical protein
MREEENILNPESPSELNDRADNLKQAPFEFQQQTETNEHIPWWKRKEVNNLMHRTFHYFLFSDDNHYGSDNNIVHDCLRWM